jgi:hypothetical protein
MSSDYVIAIIDACEVNLRMIVKYPERSTQIADHLVNRLAQIKSEFKEVSECR